MSSLLLWSAATVALVIASGCTIQPRPLTAAALRSAAEADRARVAAQVPPLQGDLTLAEALARALKYNLDHRTRLMEQAYAVGALDAAAHDLLPRLVASGDYSTRDNDPIRRSVDSVTGQPDQSHPFISSDRTHTVSQLTLSWNVLDFGVSYYNAHQQADRVLVASERRRKAMHELTQSVQSAYWRALSAQKLEADVRVTLREAETALTSARKVESERLKAPAESLRFQRALLENLRTLESVQQELGVARFELASLMNLPAQTPFRLADSTSAEALPELGAPLEELEIVALTGNASLREETYNARIAAVEARKGLLKLLPGLNFSYGGNRDTDSFLINRSWAAAGVQATSNLFNVFAYPSQKALGKAGVQVAEARRVALEMAVVTQVHVAAYQLAGARQQFERADSIWQVDNRMQKLAEDGQSAKTESQLVRIATHTSAILSLLRRYQALTALHSAAGKMQATLGLEPQIGDIDTITLPDLTRVLEQSAHDWQRPKAPPAAARPPK